MTGSDAVARRAWLDRAAGTVAARRMGSADSQFARAAAAAATAHDSIVEAEAQFGRVNVALDQFAFAAGQPFVRPADSTRPPSDAILAATSACVHAALHPSDSALRAATLQADRTGDPPLAARCLAPLPAFLFSHGLEDSSNHAGSEVIARFRRVRDHGALTALRSCFSVIDDSRSWTTAPARRTARRQVQQGVSGSFIVYNWMGGAQRLGVISRLLGDAAATRAHNARGRVALLTINDQHGLGILRRNDADLALDAKDTAAARAAALDALHAAPARCGRGRRPGVRLADVALRERRFVEAKRDIDSNVAALVRGHAEVFVPAGSNLRMELCPPGEDVPKRR